MANNMTFNASLRLNTKEFRKGIADVQRSLKSLQNSFLSVAGALGVGLSFTKVISEAKKTATELSVSMAVLENASKITNKAGEEVNNFATNLQYVRGLAKKYKQDFLALTNTFAQFTAAANQVKDANGNIALSLDEQKYIYEQLTRAAAGYHMSADRTKDMMNAIVQMMSKGKIAAEELRRQLGNSLPGAFGMMAAAMGVSNAELEDMMRKGQVMTADALPKFAKLLEGVTEHMTFDSLQNSTNELKNAWVDLVDELDLSATFKKLTDMSTNFLRFIKNNINNITSWIAGIFTGGIVFRGLNSFSTKITEINNKWRAQIVDLEKANEHLFRRVVSSARADSPDAAVRTTTKMLDSGKKYVEKLEIPSGVNVSNAKFNEILEKRVKIATEYNNNLLAIDRTQRKLGYQGILSRDERKSIESANKELAKMVSTYREMPKISNPLIRGLQRIGGLFLEIGAAIKSIAISTAAMAAFSAIVGLVVKWYTNQKLIREEQERINSIVPNYEKSIEKIRTGTTQTATSLRKLADSLKGMDTGSPEYASKIQEINKQLGLTGDAAFTIKTAYDEIVKTVDEWIDKQRSIATINKALASQDEAVARKEQINDTLSELDKQFYKKFGKYAFGYINRGTGQKIPGATNDMSKREWEWIRKNILPQITEIRKQTEVIEKAEQDIAAERNKLAAKYGVDVSGDEIVSNNNNNNNKNKTKGDTPKSVMEDYLKKRKEIEYQYKNGAIPTEEEFKEKMMDLEDSAYETLAAFGEWEDIMKKLSKSLREDAEKLRESFKNNLEYKKEREKQKEKPEKQENLEDKIVQEQLKALEKFKIPNEKKRDTTFDYLKKPLEIKAEIADIKWDRQESIQEMIDALKEGIKTGDFDKVIGEAVRKLLELVSALQEAKREATDLKKKVKLAEAIEKLDEKIKEMQEDTFSNITGIAQSFDRVNNSLMSIAEIFDEDIKDSEFYQGFQKFGAILNHTIQMIESLISITQTLQTIQELAANKKVAAAAKEVLANEMVAESEVEKATAAASAAAAGGASAVASIPWVGPALAVAAVATIIGAILAGMKKFANGGFIGGHSYAGDKQIARVNSGELVLNPTQQRNLLNLANGKGTNGNGQVEFKIRGADLVGSIKNYNRLTGNK